MSRYNLRYSRIALGIELALHAVVFIAIVQLLSDWWLIVFITLFFLIAVRYFKKESVRSKFPAGSAIELRESPPAVVWYDEHYSNTFSSADIELYMTRWFILLVLGRGCACRRKLLLVDSFDDKNLYTRFRRKLNEMTIC